jgi:hypothetical protein
MGMAGMKLAKDGRKFDRWSLGTAAAVLGAALLVVSITVVELTSGGGSSGSQAAGAGRGGEAAAPNGELRALDTQEQIASERNRVLMPLATDIPTEEVARLKAWVSAPAGSTDVAGIQLRVRIVTVAARCRTTDGDYTPWQPRDTVTLEQGDSAVAPVTATTIQDAALRKRLEDLFRETPAYKQRTLSLPRYDDQIGPDGNFAATTGIGLSSSLGAYLETRARNVRCDADTARLADRIPDQVWLRSYRFELLPADFHAHA